MINLRSLHKHQDNMLHAVCPHGGDLTHNLSGTKQKYFMNKREYNWSLCVTAHHCSLCCLKGVFFSFSNKVKNLSFIEQ